MNTYSYTHLREFTRQVLKQMGHSDADAELGANVLLAADLRGVDSHGIARLSGYVRLWEGKRMNPTPNVRILHESPSTATVDGDQGLGLVVAPKAMEIAIAKAKAHRPEHCPTVRQKKRRPKPAAKSLQMPSHASRQSGRKAAPGPSRTNQTTQGPQPCGMPRSWLLYHS